MATQEAPTPVPPSPPRSGLDRYFAITERGSTVRTEVVAGVTTFMTMAYILFLNPLILVHPRPRGHHARPRRRCSPSRRSPPGS